MTALVLLLQPVHAQQEAFTEPPLFLDHEMAMQPVEVGAGEVTDSEPGSRRQPADRLTPPQQPDLMFGEYRSWEVGVGTRRSVGVMIKRDFR